MSGFRRRLMMAAASASPLGKYIQFEDAEVERICMENFSSDGIGVSYEDAEKVTEINSQMGFVHLHAQTFAELTYFTNLTRIKNYSFAGTTLQKIVFPQSLKVIETDGFIDSYRLKNVNFDYVEHVGTRAFQTCDIEILRMPSLKTLGSDSFKKAKALKKVLDLGSISILNSGVFVVSPIDTIILPTTIKQLKNYSIYNLTTGLTLIVKAIQPPTLDELTFGTTAISAIYVINQSVEAYKTAPNWSKYADKIKPLSEYVIA